MSSNKQQVELTDINAPLLEATQGLTMEDRDASTSTPIIDRTTEVNQTPYYVDESDDETIRFLIDCADRGEKRGMQPSPSICKVSRILRDDNEIFFTPQLVSIGPIHREDPKLKEFEWLKECYLDDLLSRCSNSMPKEKILEECLLKVNTLIPQIRESYAGVIENYSDFKLARMMVMDGCFILEFCFKCDDRYGWHLPNEMLIFRIAKDLILLENQVPFFVLQALFDCLAPHIMLFCVSPGKNSILCNLLDKYLVTIKLSFSPEKISTTDVDSDLPEKNSILSIVLDKYLAHYIKRFCSLLLGKISTTNVDSDEKISTTNVDSDSSHAHVLGYLHKHYQLVVAESSNSIEASHSIVELDRSGMNFKPHQEDKWSMTIKFQPSNFWSKPALLMPTLVIYDSTELILRNFIAYEQSFPHNGYYFTSYAYAMDKLIDTQEDIAKLVESKVLVNELGSNQEAADMINRICKNVFVTEFYYTEEFKQMDKYYNGFWPKHIARLRRVYFSNPWSIIALVAAVILFSLTVVQTIYTVVQTVYTIRAA